MALFAKRKIITPKSALAVMTRRATLAAAGGVMIQWLRRGDLSSLRHPRSYLMTFFATVFLMLGMVKADPECLRRFRSSRVAAQLMTGAT